MEKKTLTFEGTKNKALKYLEYRVHSAQEMRQKLKRAGAEEENIERVMDFLCEYKFINDEEFARLYINELKNMKKFGKKRVRMELARKGIPAEIAEQAMLEAEWNEEEVLLPMMRKKLGGDFERKNIEKAIRYFSTKGYGYDEIKSAIESLKTEEE